MQAPTLSQDRVRLSVHEGRLTWRVKCPKCGKWTAVSDEEFAGLLPIGCAKNTCPWAIQEDLHDCADWSNLVPGGN